MDEQEPKQPEKAPEPELPPKPTQEQLDEADRLIQEASLARIRGQGSVAERLLKQASEVAPGSPAVQVALGDELWKRGQYSRARDAYKMAHRIEPGNVAYETKWAESLVGSAGDPLNMSSLSETYANAKAAAVLSFFIPGLGQIVSNKIAAGVTMFFIWAGAWVWALLTPDGLSGIPAAFGFKTHVKDFNGMVIVPIAIVCITWLYAVLSVGSGAKVARVTKIERPTPPGEGGFEI